jgi:hypothetical protein
VSITTEISKALAVLKADRATIDDRIAALELAIETLGGATVQPRKVRRTRKRRDASASVSTGAWLSGRGKPASISQVARALGCSNTAAGIRLMRLVESGKARRIARGLYEYARANGAAS